MIFKLIMLGYFTIGLLLCLLWSIYFYKMTDDFRYREFHGDDLLYTITVILAYIESLFIWPFLIYCGCRHMHNKKGANANNES